MPLDFPDQRCVPYFRDEIDAKNVCNSYPGQCKEGFLNNIWYIIYPHSTVYVLIITELRWNLHRGGRQLNIIHAF